MLRDLRPYVCTYADCKEGDQLYDRWKDWANHEQWAHKQALRCAYHPKLDFADTESFKKHWQTSHQNLAISSDEASRSSVTVSQSCSRLCPICKCKSENMSLQQQHIATHLQRIALFALPNSSSGDEENSSEEENIGSVNQVQADDRVSTSENESLTWSDSDREVEKPPSGFNALTIETLGKLDADANEENPVHATYFERLGEVADPLARDIGLLLHKPTSPTKKRGEMKNMGAGGDEQRLHTPGEQYHVSPWEHPQWNNMSVSEQRKTLDYFGYRSIENHLDLKEAEDSKGLPEDEDEVSETMQGAESVEERAKISNALEKQQEDRYAQIREELKISPEISLQGMQEMQEMQANEIFVKQRDALLRKYPEMQRPMDQTSEEAEQTLAQDRGVSDTVRTGDGGLSTPSQQRRTELEKVVLELEREANISRGEDGEQELMDVGEEDDDMIKIRNIDRHGRKRSAGRGRHKPKRH